MPLTGLKNLALILFGALILAQISKIWCFQKRPIRGSPWSGGLSIRLRRGRSGVRIPHSAIFFDFDLRYTRIWEILSIALSQMTGRFDLEYTRAHSQFYAGVIESTSLQLTDFDLRYNRRFSIQSACLMENEEADLKGKRKGK